MQTVPINILSRIKMFIQINSITGKGHRIVHKKKKQVEQSGPEEPGSNERSDLELFQRKAYMGHFMAGPMAFINPALFK